jgi:hypothetical protein
VSLQSAIVPTARSGPGRAREKGHRAANGSECQRFHDTVGPPADALQIPVGTAKSRLHHAIDALRAAVSADEPTPIDAAREERLA